MGEWVAFELLIQISEASGGSDNLNRVPADERGVVVKSCFQEHNVVVKLFLVQHELIVGGGHIIGGFGKRKVEKVRPELDKELEDEVRLGGGFRGVRSLLIRGGAPMVLHRCEYRG